MVNDPEYESFEHPVDVAYVCSIDPFEVYWYQCNEDQLQRKQRGKLARAFRQIFNGTKNALRQLTVCKYWNRADWFRPGRKGARPPEAQILANWHRSTREMGLQPKAGV